MSIDTKSSLYYGIKDPALAEFKILTNIDSDSAKVPPKTAVFISEDTGDGKTTAPVAFELIQRGWGITAIVRGPAYSIYSTNPQLKDKENFNPDKGFIDLKTNAVITSASTISALHAWGTALANANGVFTLEIEDYPGDFSRLKRLAFLNDPLTVPRFATAMDERAIAIGSAKFTELQLPAKYTPKFIVTGKTSLDPLASFNREEAVGRVRSKLNLPNVDIYTFLGSIGTSTVESLWMTIEALRDVDPNNGRWLLGLRLHPGDAENIDSGAYMRAINPVAGRAILLMAPHVENVLDAIAVSKVVLQERSGTALEAAAMDVQVGSIVHPDLVRLSTLPEDLWVPTNSDGTSPMARNLEETRHMIARFDRDRSFTDNLRRKRAYYRPDGKAYLRVADFIEANIPK